MIELLKFIYNFKFYNKLINNNKEVIVLEQRNKIAITALLLLTKDDKILLTRRYNTGYEDGKYSLPGGHVEKGDKRSI